MGVIAIHQIRRMRGRAQSHLMLASDKNLYVVKFRNNPQHIRVLANELLATRLAEALGLSVPPSEIIEVTDWLITKTPELRIDGDGGSQPCQAGLQFASRWVGGLTPGHTVDYLPRKQLLEVRNLSEFAGILALDKWTCNISRRQAVFQKGRQDRRYSVTFIGHGNCFHAGEWKFSDTSLGGEFGESAVYRGITGWASFEPWLARIEKFPPESVWAVAESIPPEWYGRDVSALTLLVELLIARRARVRDLIKEFRETATAWFPNWGEEGRNKMGVGLGRGEWIEDGKHEQ